MSGMRMCPNSINKKKIFFFLFERLLKIIISNILDISVGKNQKTLSPVSILSKAELPINQPVMADRGLNCCSKIE